MTGMPGKGCTDPRHVHAHWCGFCGAEVVFSLIACQSLVIVPPCPCCGEMNWRDEIDALTGPDFREVAL